jgi:hypothetical protein
MFSVHTTSFAAGVLASPAAAGIHTIRRRREVDDLVIEPSRCNGRDGPSSPKPGYYSRATKSRSCSPPKWKIQT